jgi:hypothetical protein
VHPKVVQKYVETMKHYMERAMDLEQPVQSAIEHGPKTDLKKEKPGQDGERPTTGIHQLGR